MNEQEKARSATINSFMKAFLPIPGKESSGLLDVMVRAQFYQGPEVEFSRLGLTGEGDVTIRRGTETLTYSIRRVKGHLRTVRIVAQGSGLPHRTDYVYDEGRLIGKDLYEGDEHIFHDTYVRYNILKIDKPLTFLPAQVIERFYFTGKPKDMWTELDILTDFYPHSWAENAFRAKVDDPFTPNPLTKEEAERPIDLATDPKVKEGDVIERYVSLPTLKEGHRIKATLLVERYDPEHFIGKLKLLRTELVG